MKRLIILPAIFVFNFAIASNRDTVSANASLQTATVYYGNGATLNHHCRANLKKGIQFLVINNIAMNPDINTIQIKCPDEVTILSYLHNVYTKPVLPVTNPLINRYKDSIKRFQSKIDFIGNNININEDQLKRLTYLIENNFTTPDKKNISSEELIKLAGYYGEKVKQIKTELYNLNLTKFEANEKIIEFTNKINELIRDDSDSKQSAPIGQLIVQINTSTAIAAADFDLEYFTRNAGWIASYDIKVKSLDNMFKVLYKAKVNQTTGLDWNDVKLNLSTANPNLGNEAPVLFPTYLQIYAPVLYNTLSNAVSVADESVVLTARMPAMAYKDDFSKTKKNADISDYLTLRESQLNTNFEINLPYTIPSDGNAYSVDIKEEKIKALYEHYSIPKLDNDVFLIAKLSDWDKLSLLPGEANIIMDNVYLGKSTLNPNTTEDTLIFSLGRDKRISIDRTLTRDYTSVKRNDTKSEIYSYIITVKNNKNQAVDLTLKDQYPISNNKEIEVILTQTDDAEIDKETGLMTWKMKLQPGESKKIKFTYQIKYPKDKIIQESR